MQRVPLFSDAEDGFILSLVKSLRSLHLAAGAIVLYEGEIADDMSVPLIYFTVCFPILSLFS